MTTLLGLKPTSRARVIDLVEAAGINVSDWSNFKGGAAKAATNPKYCYEWAFIEPAKLVVLNLWWENTFMQLNSIVQVLNLKSDVEEINNGVVGKSARVSRARRMDEAISVAWQESIPVRVVMLDGNRRDRSDRLATASKVNRRQLDPIHRAITAYNPRTGETIVTQGATPSQFIDQFDVSDRVSEPRKKEVSVAKYDKDRRVRHRQRQGSKKWLPLDEKSQALISGCFAFTPKNHLRVRILGQFS